MEMGNVPKRQQPDHRADNSWRLKAVYDHFLLLKDAPDLISSYLEVPIVVRWCLYFICYFQPVYYNQFSVKQQYIFVLGNLIYHVYESLNIVTCWPVSTCLTVLYFNVYRKSVYILEATNKVIWCTYNFVDILTTDATFKVMAP